MNDDVLKSIEALSNRSRKLLKAIRECMVLKENPVDNAYLLERKVMTISTQIKDLPLSGLEESLQAWIERQRKDIELGKEEIKFQFGNRLKELCKEGGIEIRGQYPLLRLGLYTLKLNFELGEATLYFGPEIEKIRAKIPLQAEIIYDIVLKHRHDITSEDAESNSLIRDMQIAYERCARRNGKAYGERLLIMDVLQEYVFMKQSKKFAADASRQNFREYPRAKMSFMFYQIRKYGKALGGMHLHVATFDATVDKAKSLWIPDDEEGKGTHYEYISFEPS
jgi:hypothetical protein